MEQEGVSRMAKVDITTSIHACTTGVEPSVRTVGEHQTCITLPECPRAANERVARVFLINEHAVVIRDALIKLFGLPEKGGE